MNAWIKNQQRNFKRLPLFLLFLSSFSLHSQNKKNSFLPENNKTLYYRAGLPHIEWENTMSEAAKKFGFSYYRVAGCVIPEDFRKYIDKHNKKLKSRLEKKYVGWQEKFDKEFDRLYSLFSYADTLLMQSQVFWDNNPATIDGKDSFHYFEEMTTDSVLSVKIIDVVEWFNNNKLVSYKRFQVDIRTKEVKILADKPKDLQVVTFR
jgi:hypothetical protein